MAATRDREGTVVVTGGAQGIGEVLCRDLATRGYHVVVADRNVERAEGVAGSIRSGGGHATALDVDVADEASCARAADRLETEHGAVIGLVNNAAVFSTLEMKPFWQIPLDEWTHVLSVNLTGTWLMSRALLPLLRREPGASIVNISAAAVWFGRANYAHYVSSKAGMIGLTRAMARELGPIGIRANAVTPGSVQTGVTRSTVTPEQRQAIIQAQCLARALTPEDLTSSVAFLLDPASAAVTGQVVNADGGMVMR